MFPEVANYVSRTVQFVQLLGAGVFLVTFAIGAILLMTAFGNERRQELGKASLICSAVGLFFLLIATVIQTIIARIAGVAVPK